MKKNGKYIDRNGKAANGRIILPSIKMTGRYSITFSDDDAFITLKNGVKDGPFLIYDEEAYQTVGNYKNGNYDGKISVSGDSYSGYTIYKDNKIIETHSFSQYTGSRSTIYAENMCTQIEYSMVNGEPYRIQEFKGGKRNGKYQLYESEGMDPELICEAQYIDDEFISGWCIEDGKKTPATEEDISCWGCDNNYDDPRIEK